MPKAVKPPKHVTVGPHTYKITCDKRTMNDRCRNEGADLLGSSEHRHLVIDIEPDQAGTQQQDTLLHELLHCVFDVTGIAAAWSTEAAEDTIRRVSPVLLDTLRRNPKLVAYLTAE